MKGVSTTLPIRATFVVHGTRILRRGREEVDSGAPTPILCLPTPPEPSSTNDEVPFGVDGERPRQSLRVPSPSSVRSARHPWLSGGSPFGAGVLGLRFPVHRPLHPLLDRQSSSIGLSEKWSSRSGQGRTPRRRWHTMSSPTESVSRDSLSCLVLDSLGPVSR